MKEKNRNDICTVERTDKYEPMFVQVDADGILGVRVVYNRFTKVMYAVSCAPNTRGNMTLLVNADGTPMIWENE